MATKKEEPIVKRLRTGELAVWDPSQKAIVLLPPLTKDVTQTARVIRGASLKALQESLGDVIVLD
jgi:hypothetical protein